MKSSTALWYGPQEKLSLRTELLCPPSDGDVVLEALWSGVSLGTERLVFRGAVPSSEWQRMRCPYQSGSFGFPVKYGYGFVGRIMEGKRQELGKTVFCLHPHQTDAVVSRGAVYLLPEDIPARRAVLAANMETAVNIVWDSGVSIGDRVLVVGAGVVGQLVGFLLNRIHGVEVTVCDVQALRRAHAEHMGAQVCEPGACPNGLDVAINVSGSGEGLQTAIDAVGLEGRVVEASWFGDRDVSLKLGGAFHSGRLQLVSSQVGRVPTDRRIRWTNRRRMELAISLLSDAVLDTLVTHELDFRDTPDALPPLFDDPSALAVALRYPAAGDL